MKRVLVTGVGSGGHGEQILKALSMSSSDRFVLFGADANPNVESEWVEGKVHPLPLASEANYVKEVFSLAQNLEAGAVFHGSEPELAALIGVREKFDDAGIFLATNSKELVEIGLNKHSTSEVLQGLGFGVPRYWLLDNERGLDSVDEFPVVVKPYLGGGGSRDVYIAQDSEDLAAVAQLLGFFSQGSILFAQKYIGTAEQEFTVGVLHNPRGDLLGSVAMKRDLTSTLSLKTVVPNRTGNRSLGKALHISSGVSQGIIADFPEIREACERIAGALRSVGPLNIQCRKVGEEIYVFELNPRFSGTTSARAIAGFNEPEVFLRSHFYPDQLLDLPQVQTGTLTRQLTETFISQFS